MRAEGLFERLGSPDANGRWKVDGETGSAALAGADHEQALGETVKVLEAHLGKPLPIETVGHRVVHGGEFFRDATVVSPEVVEKIEHCRDLAPLHNPANILGIQVAQKFFPGVPHVAVFDTAFHQTLPRHAYLYAVPYELYEKYGVRRYGFHGTSHEYVAHRAAEAIGRPLEELHLVTAHLGNGCSACAVREGKSVDTTMGLTPLEGLVMGTRSGDIDPDLPQFLRRVAGMSADDVAEMLNRRSGLLGVSGVSNDMRAILEAAGKGSERASIAIDLFSYRLARAILGLTAALDRLDALVFTGGIGENSIPIRARTISFLSALRAAVDPDLNATHGRAGHGRISNESSGLLCLVVPTSEERAIAEHASALLTTPS